eukprot:12249180-Alexandrium_andersonii.AAC.1
MVYQPGGQRVQRQGKGETQPRGGVPLAAEPVGAPTRGWGTQLAIVRSASVSRHSSCNLSADMG